MHQQRCRRAPDYRDRQVLVAPVDCPWLQYAACPSSIGTPDAFALASFRALRGTGGDGDSSSCSAETGQGQEVMLERIVRFVLDDGPFPMTAG